MYNVFVFEFRKALQRQLKESVEIDGKKPEENLNSKNEFNGQRIRRLIIDSDPQGYKCFSCSSMFNSRESLKRHKKEVHEESQTPLIDKNRQSATCDVCTTPFSNTESLKRYKREVHEDSLSIDKN